MNQIKFETNKYIFIEKNIKLNAIKISGIYVKIDKLLNEIRLLKRGRKKKS